MSNISSLTRLKKGLFAFLPCQLLLGFIRVSPASADTKSGGASLWFSVLVARVDVFTPHSGRPWFNNPVLLLVTHCEVMWQRDPCPQLPVLQLVIFNHIVLKQTSNSGYFSFQFET